MRTRLALLTALVIAMVIVAITLTSSQFAFSDWPMAPGPEQAEHVVVGDVQIDSATGTTAADRGTDGTDAVKSSGTRVGDSSTAPASVRVANRVPATRTERTTRSKRTGRDAGPQSGDDRSADDSTASANDSEADPTGALEGTTPASETEPAGEAPIAPASVKPAPSRMDTADAAGDRPAVRAPGPLGSGSRPSVEP